MAQSDKHPRRASPKIHAMAFIAPTAIILGDVEIGEGASVWYHCIIDGRLGPIRIGARTNIQDHSWVSVSTVGRSVTIGADVLIGHTVTLAADVSDCVLEDESFVGIYANVRSSTLRSRSIVAARAQILAGSIVPTGQMWGGAPGQKIRELKPAEESWAMIGSTHYVHEAQIHRAALLARG